MPTAFIRDHFTWLAYLMLGYYAYLQATLGPLMPFLGTELHLNYTTKGYHISTFALGMALAGLVGNDLREGESLCYGSALSDAATS